MTDSEPARYTAPMSLQEAARQEAERRFDTHLDPDTYSGGQSEAAFHAFQAGAAWAEQEAARRASLPARPQSNDNIDRLDA